MLEAFASCMSVNLSVELFIDGLGCSLQGRVYPNFTGPNPIIFARQGINTRPNFWQIVQFLLKCEVWKEFDCHYGFDLKKIEDESQTVS